LANLNGHQKFGCEEGGQNVCKWPVLPTAGDRTRTRRRDRCSDTSTNSVMLARTMFGQIRSLSNARFRMARFVGGMAMFGQKRNGREWRKVADLIHKLEDADYTIGPDRQRS